MKRIPIEGNIFVLKYYKDIIIGYIYIEKVPRVFFQLELSTNDVTALSQVYLFKYYFVSQDLIRDIFLYYEDDFSSKSLNNL